MYIVEAELVGISSPAQHHTIDGNCEDQILAKNNIISPESSVRLVRRFLDLSPGFGGITVLGMRPYSAAEDCPGV
jgi:hypothetical protein